MTLSLLLALPPASGSEPPGKCPTKPWAARDPGPALRGSGACLRATKKSLKHKMSCQRAEAATPRTRHSIILSTSRRYKADLGARITSCRDSPYPLLPFWDSLALVTYNTSSRSTQSILGYFGLHICSYLEVGRPHGTEVISRVKRSNRHKVDSRVCTLLVAGAGMVSELLPA